MSERAYQRVLEKFYSPAELSSLLGFAPKFWRERAQAGDFTLHGSDEGGQETVIAQPVEIAGELRIPASGVNAWLARHPYRPELGVKARNAGELRRKLSPTPP